MMTPTVGKSSSQPSPVASHARTRGPSISASFCDAALRSWASATLMLVSVRVRGSREPDGLARLEHRAATVPEHDPEEPFVLGPEPERDQRIVGEGRGHDEPADAPAAVDDLHLGEEKRLGHRDKLAVAQDHARPYGMLELDLDIDDVARLEAASPEQMGEPDHGRADLGAALVGGGRNAGAAATSGSDLQLPGAR